MKILKARNGIALVAVLAIMLISSMFIPVMFNLSDTSLMIAVKGTDRQRASYLARTVTEMSVAAFKSFESNDHVRCKNPTYTNGVCNSCSNTISNETNNIIAKYNKLIDKNDTTVTSIRTDVIVMFQKDNAKDQPVYYLEYLDENGDPINERTKISKDRYIDLARALIEFEEKHSKKPVPYKLYPAINRGDVNNPTEVLTEKIEDIKYVSCSATKLNENDANEIPDVKKHSEYTAMVSAGYKEVGRGYCTITYDSEVTYYKTNVTTKANTVITKADYEAGIATLTDPTNTATQNYSYSKKENRNLKFVSTAEVNGFKSSRTCILVLPTYPSEEGWLQFGIVGLENSGGNQVFVDASKATSLVPVSFEHVTGSYIKQNLLVYSAVGNMLIRPTSYKKAGTNETVSSGEQNSQFVLGVQPGLNTTPNNDPTYEIIDAVNYNSSTEIAQMNNFVAFAATNAIQVDMPVNLLLNPCRANRVGDNKFFQNVPNGSLFKIMMFQAPTIQFNERIDMMMSFYVRGTEDARRMSSVVLSAPESTPYSYYNEDREQVVKAGMVYFSEDSYLWIIEPMDDGSSSSGWGFLAETVYERDSDFKKIKIASAGDVYYFNSDIVQNGEDVGFSLTAYFIETRYLKDLSSKDKGFWQRMKDSFFAGQITGGGYTPTYKEDDWVYLGNLNDKTFNAEPPATDGYYTYWVN